ncbi:MAG: hypothetical protein WCJ64_14470 [Rhodospirillaceae bacterium]
MSAKPPRPVDPEAIKARLETAREEVVQAVRDRSNEGLMPALESLVQAKILSAYVEDGGLIERLRLMRAALEQVYACIPPSDRAVLERPDGGAYVRIPLSAEAYRALKTGLKG